MNDFGVFNDFRVSTWMSEGLINVAQGAAQALKSLGARAGVAAILTVAAATTISMSPVSQPAEHMAIVHSVSAEQVVSANPRAVLPSTDSELQKMQHELAVQIRDRHTISEASFAPSTLEKAQQVLARLNVKGPVFSEEWKERVSAGKA